LAKDQTLHDLLFAFSRIYYLLPALKPNRRVKIGPTGPRNDKMYPLMEPMDAILWGIEILRDGTGEDWCPRKHLEALVLWWYPHANFGRTLGHLIDDGSIASHDEPDRRKKSLKLTPKGRRRLAIIMDHRGKQFRRLFLDLSWTAAQQKAWIELLIKAAQAPWPAIQNDPTLLTSL